MGHPVGGSRETRGVTDVFAPRPGARARVLVSAEQSAGTYSIVEWEQEPGTPGPYLHVHGREEEAFLVLSGLVAVTLGNAQRELTAGDYAMVPRGTAHTFAPLGSEPARFLLILSPPGYEGYFREVAEATGQGRLPVTAKLSAEIGARYGMHLAEPRP
jgi:mannose-6-phosphate isomerase-like protein (cupin superfamily)